MALPCQTDADCMTHRCNVKYGKCVFPCITNVDCVLGTQCMEGAGKGICVPTPPAP